MPTSECRRASRWRWICGAGCNAPSLRHRSYSPPITALRSLPTTTSETLTGVRALLGNILQADECWMLDSRLSTVALRMNRQSKNAQRIAEQLAKHPRVKRLIYPSLFTDAAQIKIRDAQTDYPGSLMSLEVEGGKTGAF